MSDDFTEKSLSIMQFLTQLQGGHLLCELNNQLREVAQGVVRTGKAGSVEIKIAVNPVDSAPNAVFFKAELKNKIPKPSPATDILFVGDQGLLYLSNPRQMDAFGPRPVPSPEDVDLETGEIRPRRHN